MWNFEFPTHPARLAATLACAAFMVAAPGLTGLEAAQAQTEPDTFYTERFEPQPNQGINLLNLATSEVLAHGKLSLGFMAQYIDDPLELVNEGDEDNVLSKVISRQVRADFWVSVGLFDFLDLSVVLPLVLNQEGEKPAAIGFNGETIDSFALSDIRIIPKLRLLNGVDAGGFGIALSVAVAIPTGDDKNFDSDGEVRLTPRLSLDWTHADSGFTVVGNVGYHLRPTTELHNLVVDDEIIWGAGLRIPTPAESLKVLATVHGALPLEDNRDPDFPTISVDDSRSTPIELDAAFELTLGDFVGNVGGGLGLTQGFGSPDFRLFLSFGYVPRCVDNDGDQICNEDDQCRDEPEDFDGFEDADGCPDFDNDKDGILDVSDGPPNANGFGKCRNKPEDKDGFEDADGCPDVDNDKDGILDVNDGPEDPNWPGFGTCRDTAEDIDGFEDEDGCPDLDNDSDGIPDTSDGAADASGFGRCRNDPEDRDGFEDEDGCPDLDNDKDGTLDVDDGPQIDRGFPGFGICRDTPGPSAAKLAENGVEPPYAYPGRYPGCGFVLKPQGKKCGEFIITDKVQFGYNRATIKEVSFPLLNAVAEALIQHPWASSVRVEGHTDWHGSKKYNYSLSERRAKSVRQYLIKKGVPTARLTSKGYGMDFPLNDDDPRGVCDRCAEGCVCKPNDDAIRAKNRRVQFRIMKVDETECPIMY